MEDLNESLSNILTPTKMHNIEEQEVENTIPENMVRVKYSLEVNNSLIEMTEIVDLNESVNGFF